MPAKDKALEKGLFQLVQNVVLLRDDQDENKFYPRIDILKNEFLEISFIIIFFTFIYLTL